MDEPDLSGVHLFDGPSLEQIFRRFLGAPESTIAPRTISRVDTARAVGAFARSLTWSLRISGRHYSGLSNSDLLDVLRAQGRDFAADTRALRAHVREVLLDKFADERLTSPAAREYAADAILEWIVMRFERGGVDVRLRPITRVYSAWKRKNGLDSRIGIANGDLLAAVQEGDVIVRGSVAVA